MEKSFYYIECTCIKNVKYPNVEFHIGDIVYFNKKASSNEMYLYFNNTEHRHLTEEEKNNIPTLYKWSSHLPFTRQKKNAKKWEIKCYADSEANSINSIGEFNAVVKEIKVIYKEEEI